jgi:hypothetical protein
MTEEELDEKVIRILLEYKDLDEHYTAVVVIAAVREALSGKGEDINLRGSEPVEFVSEERLSILEQKVEHMWQRLR